MPKEPAPKENPFTEIAIVAILLLIGSGLLSAFLGGGYQKLLGIGAPAAEDEGHGFWYIFLATIFILLDGVLIGFIIVTIRKFMALAQVVPQQALEVNQISPAEEIRESWSAIENLSKAPNPSDWNMAVLRADALLDDVLREMGYEGNTIADRLRIVDPHQMPSIGNIWSAHKLRNTIAHDPLEQHTKETIDYALGSYRQAFRELGLLRQSSPEIPASIALAPEEMNQEHL